MISQRDEILKKKTISQKRKIQPEKKQVLSNRGTKKARVFHGKSNKKRLTFLLILFFVVLLVCGYFLWNIFRGSQSALVAVKSPEQSIAELLASGEKPFHLPAGFTLQIFAKVPDARVMAQGPDAGDIFVSSPNTGQVVLLSDENGDGVSDEEQLVAEHLDHPHGIQFRCDANGNYCKLYIAEEGKVSVYDFNKETNDALNPKKLMDLPTGGQHTTRSLAFDPENKNLLLISVGSSCNDCVEKDENRATVLYYNISTGASGVYAKGLRNSVFLKPDPTTGEVWATEMGRDYLGDTLPPDEINILKKDGDYGWPFCYGKNIHDTDFDKNQYITDPCADKIPSLIDLAAHSAPLGLDFFPAEKTTETAEKTDASLSVSASSTIATSTATTATTSTQKLVEGFPEADQGSLLVALHGSWNSSVPVGYKIVQYRFDEDGDVKSVNDFMTGWLKDDVSLGRPADIFIKPGGTIYITDDKAGLVYSLKYTGK